MATVGAGAMDERLPGDGGQRRTISDELPTGGPRGSSRRRADGDFLYRSKQQWHRKHGAEFVCERSGRGEFVWLRVPRRNGRAESTARTRIFWRGSGVGKAMEDAVEREPQPAIPMGSVQRDELGAIRRAVGECVRGREFGEWEFGELRELQWDVDESADYAVCVEV